MGQQARLELEEAGVRDLVAVLTPVQRITNYPNLTQAFSYWQRMYARVRKRFDVIFIFAVQRGSNAVATIESLQVPKEILWVDYTNENRFVEIANSRNVLLREARGIGAKHVLFLDSDVGAPACTIERLIDDGKDFVGAVAVTFNNAKEPVLGFGKFKEPFYSGLEWADVLPAERLSKVGYMCSICLYLGEHVLKDQRLWFPMSLEVEGKMMSEDHAFSKLVSECEYDLWVDSSIQVLHFRGEVILGVKPPAGFKPSNAPLLFMEVEH